MIELYKYVKTRKAPIDIKNELSLLKSIMFRYKRLHEKLLHINIHPKHIFIEKLERSEAEIISLRLCNLHEQNKKKYTELNQDKIPGVILYMAPERAKAEPEKFNITTDTYALSGIIYYFFAEKHPVPEKYIKNKNTIALISKIKSGKIVDEIDFDPIRKYPQGIELEKIIRKGMRYEQKDRYQSCDEIIVELNKYNDLEKYQNKKQNEY